MNCSLQGTQLTLNEEIRLFTSLVNDLQHIREAWSVILEESRIVAANLGFEEMFKQETKKTKFFMMKIEGMYMNLLTKKISFQLKCFMLL